LLQKGRFACVFKIGEGIVFTKSHLIFYQPDKMTIPEGFIRVQSFMYGQIEARLQPRFGAFPVVMEIETWLLADPTIQAEFNQNLTAPETIKHPATFLSSLYDMYKKSAYGKILDGKKLFAKTSAKRIYDDNCPHFKLMIDWITNPPHDEKKEQITERQRIWHEQFDRLEAYVDALWQRFEVSEDASIEEQIKTAENERDAFLHTYDDLFKP